jgi:pimeloyl-ACP methyl ester carboxylesterase
MASFGVKVIRTAFGLAEHLAPRLAGRVAFELFARTPDPEKMSPGEARAVERAAGFMAEARHHRIPSGRGCLAVHEFRPLDGRPFAGTVLVVHGWRSRTQFMKALIESYRNAGFRVVSLDLPGHGESSGRRLTLPAAVAAVRVAGDWFGPFAAVVGHSFGGAVAVNALAGSVAGIAPVDAAALVLIAAPSSLPAVFDDFYRMLGIGPRTRASVAARVKRLAGHPLESYDGTSQLALVPARTLVVHAPDDREVAADHASSYARAGSHVALHWAPGLGHRRILADPGVLRRALDFLICEPVTAL